MIKEIFQRESVKKLAFFMILILFAYLIKSIFNLVLLTFLITYLMNSLQGLVVKQINKFIKIKPVIVTTVLYVVMTLFMAYVVVKYIPIAINQSIAILGKLEYIDFKPSSSGIMKYIAPMIDQINIGSYVKSSIGTIMGFITGFITSLGKWSINFLMALLLSLVFILEKDNLLKFIQKFKYSKVSGIYEYFTYFAKNFLNSFGKVIQAQIMIAITNTVLSVIGLAILGFPQLFALAFMVLILSLIPVAGVIISLVPLCLIAFKIGGLIKVLFVLIMVGIIHAIESYILNPKFMSDKTNIPIFLTFVILITSEHFMGVWGLLLGIPLFIFILDLLGVDLSEKNSINTKQCKIGSNKNK